MSGIFTLQSSLIIQYVYDIIEFLGMKLVMVHLDSKLQNYDECDLGCPRYLKSGNRK